MFAKKYFDLAQCSLGEIQLVKNEDSGCSGA